MGAGMRKLARQCANCPWKVDTDLSTIPGYDPERHRAMERETIGEGIESLTRPLRVFACHKSGHPCAGWIHNQTRNNNFWVRFGLCVGALPAPIVEGEQVREFRDTLPENRREALATHSEEC